MKVSVSLNDLQYASNLLDPIMFADDNNLFYAEENIKTLFDTVNIELQKVSQWFIYNKLSLKQKQTTHFFINPARKIIFP